MSYDTRRMGGGDFVPPIEERTSQRPQSRPAPQRGGVSDVSQDAMAATQGEAARADDDKTVVRFSRTYRAYDEMVSSITLRRPVTREIKRCGNPVKLVHGPDGKVSDVEVRWDVVSAYIPLLASPPLPPSTVDEFVFEDLDACAAALIPFFVKFQ